MLKLDEMQRPWTATTRSSTNPLPCVANYRRLWSRNTHHFVPSKKRSYAEAIGFWHKLDISRVLHHIANYRCSLSFTEDFAPHAHHFVPWNKQSSAEASACEIDSTILEFFIVLQITIFTSVSSVLELWSFCRANSKGSWSVFPYQIEVMPDPWHLLLKQLWYYFWRMWVCQGKTPEDGNLQYDEELKNFRVYVKRTCFSRTSFVRRHEMMCMWWKVFGKRLHR
jgi:hypothetical protein